MMRVEQIVDVRRYPLDSGTRDHVDVAAGHDVVRGFVTRAGLEVLGEECLWLSTEGEVVESSSDGTDLRHRIVPGSSLGVMSAASTLHDSDEIGHFLGQVGGTALQRRSAGCALYFVEARDRAVIAPVHPLVVVEGNLADGIGAGDVVLASRSMLHIESVTTRTVLLDLGFGPA